MNAYKIDESGLLPNGTETLANYSTRAIFSSTIRYILLPGNLNQIILNHLLYGKLNSTLSARLERDPVDG